MIYNSTGKHGSDSRTNFTKFLLIGIFSLFSLIASASHFRYGNISWTRDATNPKKVTFKVSQAWRTSYFYSGTVPTVGAQVSSQTSLDFGDGNSSNIVLTLSSVNTSDDWMYGDYTVTHTYATYTSSYTAAFTNCCRISTLQNNHDANFTVSSLVKGAATPIMASPVSTENPIVNLSGGLTYATTTLPATDPNGYLLTYSLTPNGNFGSGTTQPGSASNFFINSSTGVISFNTVGATVGNLYNTSITVTNSLGASTMVDFIIKIVDNTPPPVFTYGTNATPANSYIYKIRPGTALSFPVIATNAKTALGGATTVTLSAVGLPSGSTLSAQSGTNPASTNFSWTPTSSNLGTYVINFVATNNAGTQTFTSVTINVSVSPDFDASVPGNNSTYCAVPGQAIDPVVIKASNPDASNLVSLSLGTTLRSGMVFSPNLPTAYSNPVSSNFSWTPVASDWGIQNVLFKATDQQSNTTNLNYYYIVDRDPVITSSPILTATVGKNYSYTLVSNDADSIYGDYTSMESASVPSFFTATDLTKGKVQVSGIPTAPGTYTIEIDLKDSLSHFNGTHCGDVLQTYQLVVADCSPSVPVITSASRCGAGSVTLTASSDAGTVVDWYDASSGGTLLTTGTSYSPTVNTTTTYYAVARNSTYGCVSSRVSATATIKSLTTSTTNASTCSGSSYTFNGTAYTTAGTYTAHLTNAVGCDSAATLVLTVKSLSTSTTNASFCDGSNYTFNGTAYSTAGTYTAHLTNSVGCDSAATLVLTKKLKSASTTNASICSGSSYTFNGTAYSTAGTYTAHLTNSIGCDSAATLVLTVKSLSTSTTSVSICSGSSYIFNGTFYTTAGTYTAHLTNSVGCDSAASLVVTVKSLSTSTTNISICSGSSYTFNGTAYTTAGTYTAHLTNSIGCDSAATLVLTIKSLSTSTTNISICSGASYTFNGTAYSTTGTYTAHLTNAVGCDSAATLVLTVKSLSTSTTNASICNGSSYTFNGTTYTTAGSYTSHLINSIGCDSAATLVLTVKSLSTSTTNISICDGSSYTFNGTAYSTAGSYTAHLTNSVGCDSAAILVLTKKLKSVSTNNASICAGGSYTFNGTAYTTAGTYTAHLINSVGCDSTATLVLTVKSLSTSTTNASICSGGSYTFNGTAYTIAGTYTAHLINSVGCDSAATLVLTVKTLSTSTTNVSICSGSSYTFNGTAYTIAGTYTAHLINSVGCDSAATLVLTIKSLSARTTNASICSGGSYTFNGTAYTTAGTYTAHLTNSVGCDSAATLVLTVKSLSTSTTNASICNGGSYTFNESTYTTAGTYTAHLTNAVGCDSAATLVLSVKALSTSTTNTSICNGGSYTFNGTAYSTAGSYTAYLINSVGCDSAATLVLTVKSLSTSTTNASICNGSSYTFNGTSYTTAGTYTAHLINCVGCDSAATLVLTVKSLSTSTTNASICNGGSYTFNGTAYSTAGTYTAHLTNAIGCDSAAKLVLTVKSLSTSTTNASICNGGSYTFNGTAYTTAGTYTAHLTNSVGCDSATTLVLTVKSLSTSTTNASICNGGSYTFNGTAYTTAGSYTAHLINSVGCDSAATLVLTVKSLSTSTTNASICSGASYIFNGTAYTTIGTYTAHLTNAVGCDSAATLVLTVKSNSTSSTNITACSSYVWNGTTYTASGIYTAHLTNVASCDSIATLNLIIKQPSSSSANITTCSSYIWNGITYYASGSYTYTTTNVAGCDSIATLNLTINQSTTSTTNASICAGSHYIFNGSSFNTSGTYLIHLNNAAGCDSIAKLILTVISTTSHIDTIVGNTIVCAGATIPLLDSTSGGKWFSTDTSIATIDSISGVVYGIVDGTSTIHYIVSSAAGCADTASIEITVGCGYVTPGSTGGLESKSLGAAIGTRNFNAYKESKNGVVEFTAANQINTPKKGHYGIMGIDASNGSLATIMPYHVNGSYLQYDESSTVADLKSITNAIEIRTVDFTLNNKPKAVAFATKTVGAIYGHTKPICDRLKGAELLNVENVKIQGYTFIRYALAQPEGEREYAISFTAGEKVGRNSYSIQSDWLMPDYIGEDTMINYQLWSASPADLNKMVTEILSRLTATMPLQQLSSSSDLPDAYISSIHRVGTDVKVTINNRTANTSGYFVFDQKKNENITIGNNVVVPFTINPYGKTTITIPIADIYDANMDMFFNNKKEDMVYMADGIWGTSSDKSTSIAQFNVTNDNNRQYSANEYALLRNVSVQATTQSYLTIYKYLKGGAAADNLSAYKTFKFTTSTSTGGLNLRVTITKKSISNWNSQYTYLITGLQDAQTYKLSLANFKSTDSTLPSVIDMSDITSVVYNIENPSGQTVSLNVGINNAAFSTQDLIYEQTLNVKTVGLYPNPNNGSFKVSFASAADAKLQLTVIDNTGRQVANIPVDAVKGKNEVSINLNNRLMNSVYYVSLQGEGTKYNTVKFIIKR